MRVSLISTVRNEGESIRRFLDAIVAQTRKPDEIIISDGNSTDNTIEIINSFKDQLTSLKVIPAGDVNISCGRNTAIKE